MAQARRSREKRLRKVLGDKPFHGSGPKPDTASMRKKLGSENDLLHAPGLVNPGLASGDGGFDDAAQEARESARAAWRKAYAARTAK